jgi:hypothetical protein
MQRLKSVASNNCIRRGRASPRTRLLTTLLNALDSGTRDCPVDSLGSVLDGLDGALASDGSGGEQASLAGDLRAEHYDVWCGG